MTEAFNEIEYFFRSLKLDKYEAKAYLTLLEHGPQDCKGLSELSGIPSLMISSTLKSLKSKGWIENENSDQRSFFYAIYPETPLRNYLISMKKFYSLAVPF